MRGSFSVPRELGLVTTADGVRLTQQPIAELQQLRGEHWQWRDEVIGPDANLLADVSGETLEIMAEFAIDALNEADRFGFRVRTGDDESTTIATPPRRARSTLTAPNRATWPSAPASARPIRRRWSRLTA